MLKPVLRCAPVLLVLCAALPVQAQNGNTTRSTRDSVFSAAQVKRGATVFASICSSCHGVEQFAGKAGWVRNWEGRTFLDVLQQISSTMPNDNPGGLSRREYVDVMTYLLHESGYPAGATDLPLTESTLRSILILPPASAGAKSQDRGRH